MLSRLQIELATSLLAQMVKILPAMQETQVWSLGREDPLEKGMATHSTILAWEFHGQRSLEGYSPWGCKEEDMTEQLTLSNTYQRKQCCDWSPGVPTPT